MSFSVKIAILRLTQMKWIHSELLRKHLVVLTCYTTKTTKKIHSNYSTIQVIAY